MAYGIPYSMHLGTDIVCNSGWFGWLVLVLVLVLRLFREGISNNLDMAPETPRRVSGANEFPWLN
jgi:hypothetical protein